MQARRDLQIAKQRETLEREAARRRESELELQAMIASLDKLPATPRLKGEAGAAPLGESKRTRRSGTDPARALIEVLHVENLRSFAGSHQIRLAPLTLVYGPNSAGKSTLLTGLKTFADVVNRGRHDALHAWQDSDPESVRGLITYAPPSPDDPLGVAWRPWLGVGIDFRDRDEGLARAKLTYSPNPLGPVDTHGTSLGSLADDDLAFKEFRPQEMDSYEHFHAGQYGEHPSARYVVRERVAGGEWRNRQDLWMGVSGGLLVGC